MMMNKMFFRNILFLLLGFGINLLGASNNEIDDEEENESEAISEGSQSFISQTNVNFKTQEIDYFKPLSIEQLREFGKSILPNVNEQTNYLHSLRVLQERISTIHHALFFGQYGLSETAITRITALCSSKSLGAKDFLSFLNGLVKGDTVNSNWIDQRYFISDGFDKILLDYFKAVSEKRELDKKELVLPEPKVPNDIKIAQETGRGLTGRQKTGLQRAIDENAKEIAKIMKKREDETKEAQDKIDLKLTALIKELFREKNIVNPSTTPILKQYPNFNEYPSLIRDFLLGMKPECANVIEKNLLRPNKLNLTGDKEAWIRKKENAERYLGKLFFVFYMDLVVMKVCMNIKDDTQRKQIVGNLSKRFLGYIPEVNEFNERLYPNLRDRYQPPVAKKKK